MLIYVIYEVYSKLETYILKFNFLTSSCTQGLRYTSCIETFTEIVDDCDGHYSPPTTLYFKDRDNTANLRLYTLGLYSFVSDLVIFDGLTQGRGGLIYRGLIHGQSFVLV